MEEDFASKRGRGRGRGSRGRGRGRGGRGRGRGKKVVVEASDEEVSQESSEEEISANSSGLLADVPVEDAVNKENEEEDAKLPPVVSIASASENLESPIKQQQLLVTPQQTQQPHVMLPPTSKCCQWLKTLKEELMLADTLMSLSVV